MKRYIIPILATVISFGSFAYAATPPSNIQSGGTGWGQFVIGSIPIGTGGSLPGSLRFATSSAFSFATSTSLLTFTFGSSTAFSATTFCLTGDTCRTTWPTSGSGGTGNVATSSGETQGFLSYWTSTNATPATLGKVATSSPTFNGGLTTSGTAGSWVGGSSYTVSLATINAGVLGAQLNSTVPTSQATSTLYGGSTGGMVLGWDNASGGIKWVATSTSGGGSVTATAPLFSSGGATPNLTWAGLATTSQPATSNLLTSNGGSGVYGTATTTATCSGTVSCTGFNILGSTPITITGSAGTSASSTLLSDVNTFSGATTTFTKAVQIGNSTGSNKLLITGDATSTASVTTGGLVNVNQPYDGAGLVITKSGTASDTGRMVVFNQTNANDVQDMFIASSSATGSTALNVKGLPTGKGIVKIEYTGGAGSPNASGLSIDLLAGSDTQGIFIKGPTGTATGKLLNIVTSGSAALFSVSASGLETSNFASTTAFTAAGYTNLGTCTNTQGNPATNNFLLDICDTNNTTSGVNVLLQNKSNGASAYSSLSFENDTADATLTHLGFVSYNSSKYYDATFGPLVNIANLLEIGNFDGGILINAATSTASSSVIYFATGGTAASNERMRITSAGLIGVGTTSPYQTFSIQGAPAQLIISNGAGNSSLRLGFGSSGNQAAVMGTNSNAGFFLQTNSANRLSVSSTGLIGIATTTSQWPLEILSATKPQLDLFDNTADNHWTFRSIAGTLYVATSTYTATSSAAVFALDPNGIPTFNSLGGSTGCAQFDTTGKLSNLGSACSTAASVFPFTPFTNYNATTTVLGFNGFFSTASSTINSTLTLTPLGTPAGAFLAVDGVGKIIATTTPAGGGSGTVGSGSIGNFPFYNAAGTVLTATSSMFITQAGLLSFGTTTPSVAVDTLTSSTTISNLITGQISFDADAGLVNLATMPINSAALGTLESIGIQLGNYATSSLQIFGVSDGINIRYPSLLFGTTSPASTSGLATSTVQFSAGPNATTTVEFDEQDTTSKTCFNVRTNTGGAASFYVVGTTITVEANRCK